MSTAEGDNSSRFRCRAMVLLLACFALVRPTPALDSFELPEVRAVPTTYEAGVSLRASLERSRPTALAAADFDEDGVPDLLCGYAGAATGYLTLHRGNIDAVFPNAPEARQRRLEGRFTDEPFLSQAGLFPVPLEPSWLAVGDFDNDGHQDAVISAVGLESLYLLRGNGRGGLRPHDPVELPGKITALAAGEVNRPDGPVDLVVGLVGPNGPAVLVFEGAEGALSSEPEIVPLASVPTQFLLARLRDTPWYDLAVATEDAVFLIQGRDRRLGYEDPRQREPAPPVVRRVAGSDGAAALAWGDFVREPGKRYELALLLDDGSVSFLARNGAADDWTRIARHDGIKTDRRSDTDLSGRVVLLPARLSGSSTQELVILDNSGSRIQALASSGSTVSLDFDRPPAAVLPMRLSGDAWTDLVLLQDGVAAPAVMRRLALATITVDTSADSATAGDGECSLREAILNANADSDLTGGDCVAGAGADTIGFQIDGGGTTATIAVDPVLPDSTGPVTIDGTTQGCASPPCIALDGSALGEDEFGLHLFDGPSTVRGMVFHSFEDSAVEFESSTSGSVFEGNFVGTDLTGGEGPGNGDKGVVFREGDFNTIGGTTPAARNVISGNYWFGLHMFRSDHNVVQGNFFGTDVTGTFVIESQAYGGRQGWGISAAIVVDNTIGGTIAGARNLFSGNHVGIRISGTGSSSNRVLGNLIGTDITGTIGLGNKGYGIVVYDGSNNTIGGTAAGARNIISATATWDGINLGRGVGLGDEPGTVIQGNYIGTDIHGTSPLGNERYGVNIGYDVVLGGTAAGAGNLISGNDTIGVSIWGGRNLVQGNLIGTDATGTLALGNGLWGAIIFNASDVAIGGVVAGSRNIISANRAGIRISGVGSRSNQILGNYIGTDISGSIALPNEDLGVVVDSSASANEIGGTDAGAGNVISGNAGDGIGFFVSSTQGNLVHGNLIGVAADGVSALGNGGDGVWITQGASNNEIGGALPGSGNVIAANGGAGVLIQRLFDQETRQVTVRQNSIYSNGERGIALGESTVWINDPKDHDDGPNGYQNYPVVTSVSVGATDTTVEGYLNSAPLDQYRIELFSNAACDPSGHGEGQSLLGVLDVSTGLGGTATFSGTFPNNETISDLISATATDRVGNTSEFSVCGADSDGDGDTISSFDDCDDNDSSAWLVPTEALGLLLSHTGGVGGTTTLTWTAPSPVAGTAAGVVYDTILSPDPADFHTSATCVASNGGPQTSATDSTDPAAETTAYFLIRAETSCGEGPLGGEGRSARSCP